ncbi:MAG: hypothetical protein ACMZ7B_03860 [Balneola sp.]
MSTIEESIPHGALLSLKFKTASDSNFVATAIIEEDDQIQCGSRESENYLPRPLFRLRIWCNGSSDTLNYIYNGYNQKVEYRDTTFDVSQNKLLVAIMRKQNSYLFQFNNDMGDSILFADTKNVLSQKFPAQFKQ